MSLGMWHHYHYHYHYHYGRSLTSLILAQIGQNWGLNTSEFTQQFIGTIDRDPSDIIYHYHYHYHYHYGPSLLPWASGVSKSMYSIPEVQWDYCLSCPVMPCHALSCHHIKIYTHLHSQCAMMFSPQPGPGQEGP